MVGLFSSAKAKKKISIKNFLSIFSVFVFLMTCLGISTLLADENDPGDNTNNTELSFQNDAQTRHAENLATQAAWHDPYVQEAKDDPDEAERRFYEKLNDYTQQISNWREQGWGWGEIAKELEVHPRYLGLGHFKNLSPYGENVSNRHHMKAEIKAATARSYTGDSMKGHGMSNSLSNGQKLGYSKIKFAGEDDSVHKKSSGLALGHGKDKGGGHGNGRGGGNGGGRGK